MNYKLLYEKQKELLTEYKKLVEFCEAPQYHEIMTAKAIQKTVIISIESELAALGAEEGEEKYNPITCDVCGRHPAVVIINQFGTFCIEHARYI
jgi:hypothetical protein